MEVGHTWSVAEISMNVNLLRVKGTELGVALGVTDSYLKEIIRAMTIVKEIIIYW